MADLRLMPGGDLEGVVGRTGIDDDDLADGFLDAAKAAIEIGGLVLNDQAGRDLDAGLGPLAQMLVARFRFAVVSVDREPGGEMVGEQVAKMAGTGYAIEEPDGFDFAAGIAVDLGKLGEQRLVG